MTLKHHKSFAYLFLGLEAIQTNKIQLLPSCFFFDQLYLIWTASKLIFGDLNTGQTWLLEGFKMKKKRAEVLKLDG
jgi:hypothetical protein